MCYYNTMIKNRKYTNSKKNKERGYVPSLPDRRIEWIPIGCGNCKECRKQKANTWRVRLLEDIKHNPTNKFITLTFSNESIKELSSHKIKRVDKETGRIQEIQIKDLTGYDRDNQIATRGLRIFSNEYKNKYGKSPRHWFITELGHNGTENIHLHGIMWVKETIEEIRATWKWGWIWPRPHTKKKPYVNGRSINYYMKYVMKIDKKHKEYKQIILTSPGIGKEYINTLAEKQNRFEQNGIDTDETYRTTTGHKMTLPIYWRNKIYNEEEREKLWIKKLDKEERWVNGVKYDISKGTKDYEKAVQEARRENAELGYGGKPNDDRKKYEEDQRQIMYETRIQAALKKAEKTKGIQQWQIQNASPARQ